MGFGWIQPKTHAHRRGFDRSDTLSPALSPIIPILPFCPDLIACLQSPAGERERERERERGSWPGESISRRLFLPSVLKRRKLGKKKLKKTKTLNWRRFH
jgi:hypothetical protein